MESHRLTIKQTMIFLTKIFKRKDSQMCFLFHNWSKWSELLTEIWTRQYFVSDEKIQYTKIYQVKVCERCGLIKKRYIQETFKRT